MQSPQSDLTPWTLTLIETHARAFLALNIVTVGSVCSDHIKRK
jgi:hypothetical protein